ncbi:hypothetical protein MTBLM5_260020 [Magnetospirillum sp. LM-5]|uniref:peptidoglycan-binding domain-containing protein n=1 Tax=Magnetospirillum sp. LM-5 TaxID=2681466 RepID=UPI00137FC68A|nr:peptidoglycan-binding domain-containing protein [Magnetospirillum sp. LM-5]CAA7618392.1 hypothetical protein MTBLM5_260020 [Magnetospirillum sp. LM-5]
MPLAATLGFYRSITHPFDGMALQHYSIARVCLNLFSLKEPMGTDYQVDPDDIVNTKTALNQLGYYPVPPERGIDDWTDDKMFQGIRSFQQDQGLKVDGFMRPGGPTEQTMNVELAAMQDRRQPNTGRASDVSPNIKDPSTGQVRTVPRPWGSGKDRNDTPSMGVDADGWEIQLKPGPFGIPTWGRTGNFRGKKQ